MTDNRYQDIRYEVAEGRARITLARPKTHNAISQLMLEELEHALWQADEDQSVHCVILKGAGPSFCAGYDLALKAVPVERLEDEAEGIADHDQPDARLKQ